MDQHAPHGLRSHYEKYAQQVRRKPRPRSISDGHDRTIDKRIDLVGIMPGDINIIASLLHGNTQAAKSVRDDPQLIISCILDGDLRSGHSGHTDKATHLDHIGEDGMLRAGKRPYTFYRQ